MSDETEVPHVIHYAASVLRVGSVIRHRCAWCGALIDEVDLERVAWQTGDGDDEHPFLEANHDPKLRWRGLVAIAGAGEGEAGTTAKWAVDDPADGKVPENSCMNLDITATT